MGDPRKIRGKYQGPRHPWNKERIETERTLLYTYGLQNKKELWKVESKLKRFKDITKTLTAQTSKQSEKELEQLFARLRRLGVIKADSTADDVLGLRLESLLGRRLQTLVHKHDLARSAKQARQFITHGHIMVGESKVTVPGYLVSVQEESRISIVPKSALASPDHPERFRPTPQAGAEEKGAAKSKEAKAQEEAPTAKTAKPKGGKKKEEDIKADATGAEEIEAAVEEAEADAMAQDHEQEVAEKAADDAKDAKGEKKEGDAQ